MSTLSIGLSSLQVAQRLLDLTGQNIANANTPSYHRQVADLAPRVAGTSNGTGVEIKNLTRVVDRLLEDAVLRNTSAANAMTSQLTGLQHLQTLLDPGEGSLRDMLERFFNESERLTTQPESISQRRVVLSTAAAMIDRLNVATEEFNRLGANLGAEAAATLDRVNALATEIARLNQEIHSGAAIGQATPGLLDQRDLAIARLAELVDLRTIPQEFGQINVFAAGAPLILNSAAVPLASSIDDQGRLIVHFAGSNQAFDPIAGKLAGLLALHNKILPTLRSQFDSFAKGLVTEIDSIHATGLGLDGPMTSLTSLRTLVNPALPLANAGLAFPPKAGDFFITVSNLATGQRSLHRISIDPTTQTLGSLAAAISAIPNLQAVVDPQAGTLNLITRPGYGFDFTGNLSTSPDGQSISGTTIPAMGGRYTGNFNDTLDFRIAGSGVVGATPNLALEVRNGTGVLISTLNIGQGYEAGTSLPEVLGVQVRLSTGTANDGDSFQLLVAADSDSAGILPALGVNSFFVGDNSGGLGVRPDLLRHPERFAASVTGQPRDGANLAEMVALRDRSAMDGKTQSLRLFLDNLIGAVGSQVQDADARSSAYQSLGIQLADQLQSVSGVDANEELIRLVQYQRAYQMSARFISAVNQTLDELFRLL